jgi:hypothetical protein
MTLPLLAVLPPPLPLLAMMRMWFIATFVLVPKMKWKMRIWYLVLVATCGMGIPDAMVCARSAPKTPMAETLLPPVLPLPLVTLLPPVRLLSLSLYKFYAKLCVPYR